MQRHRPAMLLIALLAAGPAAAAPDALGAIDACIERLDAGGDTGFERVAVRCPELARRIAESDWAAWLPEQWQDGYNTLSAQSLTALRMVVARELAVHTRAHAPQVALVRPILADLAARNPEPHGWWERLRDWLRALFAPEPRARASWYERLIGRASVSQALLEFVAVATLVLIVLLAGWIVVAEWRASGPRRNARSTGAQARATQARLLSWGDVERAAPADKLRVLLEFLVARLTAARHLPAAGALTVRELIRLVALTDAADRERLGEVAFAAERLRFSAAQSTAVSARALERGHELLERLGAADARACGGPA